MNKDDLVLRRVFVSVHYIGNSINARLDLV